LGQAVAQPGTRRGRRAGRLHGLAVDPLRADPDELADAPTC
jgi:hypothetical protein